MKKGVLLLLPLIFTLAFLVPQKIHAHPGRTAADGCHYCRTNCAEWGEVQDARHCHGGSTAANTPAPVYFADPSPIATPKPTPIPTPKPTVVPTTKPTVAPTPVKAVVPQVQGIADTQSSSEDDDPLSTLISGLIMLGIIATPLYGGYRAIKWGKKKLF